MQGIRLDPARIILASFSPDELRRLALRNKVRVSRTGSKSALVKAITECLDIDALADALRRLFPKTGRVPEGVMRLDRAQRLHGETTVQVYTRSNSAFGQLLLELRGSCLVLQFDSIPLFLENRWPVITRDAGEVPSNRLYAGYVRPQRLHPAAQAAPPSTKPYIIDEGYYGLRAGRLRVELKHSGLISFRVSFLRYRKPSGRPSYLLTPIA